MVKSMAALTTLGFFLAESGYLHSCVTPVICVSSPNSYKISVELGKKDTILLTKSIDSPVSDLSNSYSSYYFFAFATIFKANKCRWNSNSLACYLSGSEHDITKLRSAFLWRCLAPA